MTATTHPGAPHPSWVGTMGESMPKRTPLSKKTRFEIFKRDKFTCQYCGSHPPKVILEVDHIVAVVAGGDSTDGNLITSCFDCNRGKAARDLKVIPQSLRERAKLIAESEAQLLGYQEIMEARRQRIEDEMWRVAETIEPGSPSRGMSRDWTTSIKNFIEKLGLYPVLEAADKARTKFPYGGRKTFLYFCGICWKEIRGDDACS